MASPTRSTRAESATNLLLARLGEWAELGWLEGNRGTSEGTGPGCDDLAIGVLGLDELSDTDGIGDRGGDIAASGMSGGAWRPVVRSPESEEIWLELTI